MSAHVMVIDDDPVHYEFFSTLLNRAGYSTSKFQDSSDLLAAIQASQPNLLITDIIMPETDGLELIRKVRFANPGHRALAVFGDGTIDPEIYLELAARTKADRVFKKNFRKSALLAIIKELTGEAVERVDGN